MSVSNRDVPRPIPLRQSRWQNFQPDLLRSPDHSQFRLGADPLLGQQLVQVVHALDGTVTVRDDYIARLSTLSTALSPYATIISRGFTPAFSAGLPGSTEATITPFVAARR